jgi:hypothetical protein
MFPFCNFLAIGYQNLMITFKRLSRIIIIVIVSALLLSGVSIWLTTDISEQEAIWEQEMKSELAAFDPATVRSSLTEYLLKEPKVEPSEAVDDMKLLLLGYDIEQFRDDAIKVSETKAITELPQVTPGVLQGLLGSEITAQFPFIWSYIMAGSITVLGNTLSDEPIVAFYNPYFDVILLTKWRLELQSDTAAETSFKLIEAVPVTGRAFNENRDSLSTDQPIWTDSEALFEVRMVNAAQNFVAIFEGYYPPSERDAIVQLADVEAAAIDAAISVAENRVFAMLRWVIDAQNPDATVNYAAAIKQLRGALSMDTPDELKTLLPTDNPQTAAAFFELSPDIRKGMKPYLVIDKQVIFIDPINFPTGFITVYFEPSDGGYIPALVALFYLEASYP